MKKLISVLLVEYEYIQFDYKCNYIIIFVIITMQSRREITKLVKITKKFEHFVNKFDYKLYIINFTFFRRVTT